MKYCASYKLFKEIAQKRGMAGDLGRQHTGSWPAPGLDCPKARCRTGTDPLAGCLKYDGHIIGALDLFKHNSLKHYAWTEGSRRDDSSFGIGFRIHYLRWMTRNFLI